MTKEDLVAFEQSVAADFNNGLIRSPIHLAGGNEDALLEIFKEVGPNDYICCQWRSHLHCLLRGVPPAELKAAIMAGKSITLCFPRYRVISSAIAGGICSIALGLAMGIKRDGGTEKVWCFIGDMTAMMGITAECLRYAAGFDLPVEWVVESNGKSVMTNTAQAWGVGNRKPHVRRYEYELPWPHAGAGCRINF